MKQFAAEMSNEFSALDVVRACSECGQRLDRGRLTATKVTNDCKTVE